MEKTLTTDAGLACVNRDAPWDYLDKPHLVITGGPGTGKTSAINDLLDQLETLPGDRRFILCDGKFNAKFKEVAGLSLASNLIEVEDYIGGVADTLTNRLLLSESELMGKDPVFLIVDEFSFLKDEINENTLQALTQIVINGGPLNIHVILATQKVNFTENEINTFAKIDLNNY